LWFTQKEITTQLLFCTFRKAKKLIMGKYILALDQGTSSSRAMLLNADGDILAVEQLEFKQYYPQPGWVEQDPMEIWESQLKVTQKLLQQNHIDAREIHALGITNQRETTLVWDKLTGKPVYNAIVWQDKRTTGFCNELVQEGWGPYAAKNTGLVIDSYFSGTKIHWILNHVAGAKEKAAKGELLFGTVDTWLIWNLTGGKLHVTDYTNASRTLLFNIASLEWDEELLARLQIPHSLLPQVVESSAVIGTTKAAIFGAGIPIAGIAGDQQSALFGQAGFEPGLAKNTYGTGCFILMNTGSKQVISNHGLLTTLTCGTKADQPRYALEGSVFIAGLGAPYWNMNARGGIFGLTLGITDKHIVKATLESLAYQSNDVLKAMEKDAGVPIQSLNVDGGASANNYLMQFQSNLTNARVIRPKNIETTALGAAFLAGLASGFWKDRSEIARIRKIDREFEPKMEAKTRDKLCAGWQKAVKRTLDWEEEINEIC
jgi:glycerol kinase